MSWIEERKNASSFLLIKMYVAEQKWPFNALAVYLPKKINVLAVCS